MKVAIIGAGAAGCFAAANLNRTGVEVAVFEKTGKALQKVKVSGGGRCNVTHSCFDIPDFAASYPRGRQLLRKSLHSFGPQDTISWFGARGVRLVSEADGRMFPDTNDSQTVIDCIWLQMMKNGTKVYYHKSVKTIEQAAGDTSFEITFSDGTGYPADKVLIATGGFPKSEQYQWIEQLGHTIERPVPSLFTFNMPKHPITELMGVSVPMATVKIAGTKIVQRGPVLITHWGLSGPAILKTSAFAARELADRSYSFSVIINWLNDISVEDLKDTMSELRRSQGKLFVSQKNPFGLPKRLWEYITKDCNISETTRWGELTANSQNKLTEHLVNDIYEVSGKTTFKEEFVTCGGIKLSEVDPRTMGSRKVKGLYFAGEILDVDGITGGFNFQHAWSSGYIAAKAIAAEFSASKG